MTVTADGSTCQLHIFVTGFTKFSNCDRAQDFVTKLGLSFTIVDSPAPATRSTSTVGPTKVEGWDDRRSGTGRRIAAADYPARWPIPTKVNWFMTELILVIMVIYVTMVYGPIAAFLVELFPTKIRYTSMSLPYHIGNGWFGGMLPLLATAYRGRLRQHLCRALVSDRGGGDDGHHRGDLPARHQGRGHHQQLRHRAAARGVTRPRPAGREIALPTTISAPLARGCFVCG